MRAAEVASKVHDSRSTLPSSFMVAPAGLICAYTLYLYCMPHFEHRRESLTKKANVDILHLTKSYSYSTYIFEIWCVLPYRSAHTQRIQVCLCALIARREISWVTGYGMDTFLRFGHC